MPSGAVVVLECSEVVDGTRLEFIFASDGIANLRLLFAFSTVVPFVALCQQSRCPDLPYVQTPGGGWR